MTGPTSSLTDLDQAPSIDCYAVQEALAGPPRAVSLTEWALVHAHVAGCPACQKQRESLELAISSQRVEPSHRPGAKLIERSRALVISTARQVPMLVAPSARPVALSIERARLVIARVPGLLTGLRSPLAIAVQGTARGVREALAGVMRALDLASRLGVLASTSVTASTRAGVALTETTGAALAQVGRRMPSLVTSSVRTAGHVVGRVQLVITRLLSGVIRLCSSMIVALRGPALGTRQAAGAGVARVLDVLDRLGAVASVMARSAARAIGARPRAYAVFAGLAVLVTSLLFLWPRQGLDDLGSRFSGRERTSREISVPVARTPVAPAAPVPLAVTSPPRTGAGAPPPPVAAARPETPPVSQRPAEIPAPERRRATAAASPPSTDTAQSADTADPAAAIDWLLKGGNSRRQAESP
jgi:hypothetical protein